MAVMDFDMIFNERKFPNLIGVSLAKPAQDKDVYVFCFYLQSLILLVILN